MLHREVWLKLVAKCLEGKNLLCLQEGWKEWLQKRKGIITKSWMINPSVLKWERIRAAKARWTTQEMWKCVAGHQVWLVSLTIPQDRDHFETLMATVTKFLQRKWHLNVYKEVFLHSFGSDPTVGVTNLHIPNEGLIPHMQDLRKLVLKSFARHAAWGHTGLREENISTRQDCVGARYFPHCSRWGRVRRGRREPSERNARGLHREPERHRELGFISWLRTWRHRRTEAERERWGALRVSGNSPKKHHYKRELAWGAF